MTNKILWTHEFIWSLYAAQYKGFSDLSFFKVTLTEDLPALGVLRD